jgi:hypothetical protein
MVGDGAEEDPELMALKASLLDSSAGGGGSSTTSHIAALVALTRTVDQVRQPLTIHTEALIDNCLFYMFGRFFFFLRFRLAR